MFCGCRGEKVSIDQARYSVIERIAEGGFAEIDLVQNDKGKQYALKRQLCFSEEEKRITLREVEFYDQFDHVNIVQCVGYTVNEGGKRVKAAKKRTVIGKVELECEVCILFPFYRRGSLLNVVELMKLANENWSDFKVVSIFRGICSAVEAIHSQSPVLAHADLKPANILLTEKDVPVLTDFGSMRPARIMVQDKRTARQVQDEAAQRCSMLFRAPELFEVATDTLLDERIDIWALGCVLYSMCYYESPFERVFARGDSLALATLNARVSYPANPVYSPVIRSLIDFMLVSDPARRPFIDAVVDRVDATLRKLSKSPSSGDDVELFVRTEPPFRSSLKAKRPATGNTSEVDSPLQQNANGAQSADSNASADATVDDANASTPSAAVPAAQV